MFAARFVYAHGTSGRRTWAGLLALLLLAAGPVLAAESTVSFNRDIRPILAENCFQCHGPDADAREADLRLDTFEGATAARDSGLAIKAGDPKASQLMERVLEADDDLKMPPPATEKSLSASQIDLLRRWIESGAKYEKHWSFAPVARREPPTVAAARREQVHNAIDRFLLQRLEPRGMTLSPPAPRATLIRRVYLDLLGVTPSPQEVVDFETDASPDAYSRLLDRVFASPRFGERWGRHWLDQARYADSHGYTNDNARVMWPYRDWVIAAFNRDLPFDRFTIEQLAGDLLPDATLDQIVATGFHRNTLINSEGGTKADQFRDEQVKDRVDTTGSVWLGLTVGCAKCHPHKYDPISQREYYSLYSFFNSTQDKNSIVPTVKAPSFEQALALNELQQQRAALEQTIADDQQRSARQQAWEKSLLASSPGESQPDSKKDDVWTILELDGKAKHGAVLKRLDDLSLLATGANKADDEYKLTARSPLTEIRSVRVEALTEDSLPKRGPGRAGNGNFVLSEFWFRTGDGRELRFQTAFADHSQKDYQVSKAIDGKTNSGWAINGSPEGGVNHNRVAWFVLPKTLTVEEKHALTFTMQFKNKDSAYNLGRFRISISPQVWVDRPSRAMLAKLAAIPASERSDDQRQRLQQAFLVGDNKLGPVQKELQLAITQINDLKAQTPSTMVMRELPQPRQAHVQTRGDFLRPAEPVSSDVPDVLPRIDSESPQFTRLDLARWLSQADHPLAGRVRVNRIWMRLFGVGLVATDNDFGVQGSLPTHPHLLDWLASEFREQAWSTKRILREIVTSAAYRQSSAARAEQLAKDPANKWLGRQNRIRVEAEIVRDIGLSVSGLLTDKIGGPSVYPPQPKGVYAFTQRKKNWNVSQGEDRYRRGMYTFFFRSAPYPMLTTFDAPKFNQTCTGRVRSNTPLQSLNLANGEAVNEMTRHLAESILNDAALVDDTARLRDLFRRCFARPPAAAELEFLERFLKQQRLHFNNQQEDAQKLLGLSKAEAGQGGRAAWVAVVRVMFNLDEFLTRE